MSSTLIKAKSHYPYSIGFALLTVPFWSALWIAHKYYGDISLWRPWLLLTAKSALTPEEWVFSIKAGFVGALMTGAGLFWLFDGMVFGTTATRSHGDARWASRGEIKKAKLLNPWGIVLGKFGKPKQRGEYLRAQSDNHGTVLTSGPPRSGKTAGILTPTMLEYRGSPIVYDVKGEIYENTSRARVQKGDKVLVLAPYDIVFPHNPDASLVGQSHGFNPLIEIAEMEDLEQRLTEIGKISAALLAPKSYGGAEASLMEDADTIFKAAGSIVCNEPNPSIGRILEILTPQIPKEGDAADYRTMFAMLAARAPEPLSRAALMRFSGQDNKQLGIYMSVLLGGGLKAWESPAIQRATQKNEFDFSKLRWEPHSIYICIPEAYRQEAKPLVRLFIQHALNVLRRRLVSHDEVFLPVLFAIDEFHSLGKMEGVLQAVTTLPGYGGRLLLIVQSPASLREHYGAAGEDIFLESAQLHVWLTPNNDETKAKLSKALGNMTISQKSISGKAWSSRSHEGRNESWSEKGRALLTPEEVGRLGSEEVIITGKGLFPIRTDRVSYFKDRYFKCLYDAQKSIPWPQIPRIKDGKATTFDEFLRSADGNPDTELERSQLAEDDADQPVLEPEEVNAGDGEGSLPESIGPDHETIATKTILHQKKGDDEFADFEDIDSDVSHSEGTGSSEHLLSRLFQTVKTEIYDERFRAIVSQTPPDPVESDSEEFVRATHRLSSAELLTRLGPLFEPATVVQPREHVMS